MAAARSRESGQLPTLAELVSDAGRAAAGAILAEQAEDEEPAPDTERRPFIDAEGVET
jgi:hypothetical protein